MDVRLASLLVYGDDICLAVKDDDTIGDVIARFKDEFEIRISEGINLSLKMMIENSDGMLKFHNSQFIQTKLASYSMGNANRFQRLFLLLLMWQPVIRHRYLWPHHIDD